MSVGQLHERDINRWNSARKSLHSSVATIGARPFFDQHGFTAVVEQHPISSGVEMTNYKMVLPLPD